MLLPFIIVVLLACLMVSRHSTREHIRGGSYGSYFEFPWMVNFYDDNKTIRGGGVLIAPDWVLTAYHVPVTPGTYARIGGDDWVRILRVIPHPHANVLPTVNNLEATDIKLVQLEKHSRKTPIKISDKLPPPGTKVIIMGHGMTKSYNTSITLVKTQGLKQAIMTYVLGTTAKQFLRQENPEIIRHNMQKFAAATKLDIPTLLRSFDHPSIISLVSRYNSSCKGDSGGPAVWRKPDGTYELLGVSSGGFQGCNYGMKTMYAFYVSAVYYKRWVQAYVK